MMKQKFLGLRFLLIGSYTNVTIKENHGFALGKVQIQYVKILLLLQQAKCNNDEIELLTNLFNRTRYSPAVRPRVNSSDYVELTLTWSTAYLLGLDNKEALFTQSAVLDVEWKDDFLKWNPESFGGIQSVVIPGKDVWTPKITVLNKGHSSFLKAGFSDGQVRVHSNGTVRASHSGLLDIVCTTDARQFPFDEQDCTVLMQSGSYMNSEVKLTFSQAEVIFYSYKNEEGHPIWNVKRITTEIITSHYKSDVAFINFNLQRKSLYYACTMITPSAILSILTLSSFFIPNDSGEKLSCGLALFLSFVVFLIQIGDIVPENSNGNSVIVLHYMLCMMGSGIFILHSIIQTMLTKHKATFRRFKNSTDKVEPFHSKVKESGGLPYDSASEESEDSQSINYVNRRRCSLILLTDIVSFIVSLVLNVAGYGHLLNAYMRTV